VLNASRVNAAIRRGDVWREHALGSPNRMLLILFLLLVLLFFGLGFAVHVLWILAVIFAVVWVVGFALGRGEGAGRHRFYRW
jgi:hypothetical protein